MDIFRQGSYRAFQYLLSSVVYRLIIILYGAFIVSTHDNIRATSFYIVLIPLYVIVYLVLLGDKLKYARLLLDVSVIFAVLYGKTPLDSVCFVYALFPLISSITHTGSHSKYWPVLLLTCLLFIALDGRIVFSHIFIAVLIWLAGLQSWYSSQTNRFLSILTAHIDGFFTDNDGSKKPHEIYNSFIKEINTYLNRDYLKSIYSYTLNEDGLLWLVNSSRFIWERTLLLEPEFLGILKERRFLYMRNRHSKFFFVEQSGVGYVYRCDVNPENEKIDFRKEYVINYVLELAFGRLSTLLASEYRINETRRKAFEETKGHIDYVTRALKVMHFVRNKLSPIKTVITFFNNQDKMDPDKVKRMEERVKKEVQQANTDLAEIISTANYLLDKQNNPYGGADIENKTIKFIFVVLSEIVELHLGGTVDVSEDIKNIEQKRVVKVSTTQLKLLFTDIVSNIEKYRKSDYSIYMDMLDDYLCVTFINDIEPKKESDCNTLARDINNSNNVGIVLRKSHGVYNIKSAASVMGVVLLAETTGDKKQKSFVIKTKFKMYDGDEGNQGFGN